MNKQEKILLGLFTSFFVTLYFSSINSINLIIAGVLILYSFSLTSFNEKLDALKRNKFLQASLLFFILLLLSTLFSDNLYRGLHYIKLRIPLLVFPISIGVLKIRPILRDRIFYNFTITTISVGVACLFYAFYNYNSKNQLDAFYNDNLTSLIDQQSVYIALLVNITIFTVGYLLIAKRTKQRVLLSVGGIILYLIAYLLGSRINLAVLATVTLCFGFYYFISHKKLLELATLCIAIIMGGLVIYKVQPQMLNRFNEIKYSDYDYSNQGEQSHYGMQLTKDQWNGANFRLAAWNCGWELFKENPLIGVGLGDKKEALFSKYEQKNFRFAIETNKNVHNSYIDMLFSLGIIGFATFILTWIAMPFVYAFKRRNWLAAAFIFALACAWITENYLDRSFGGMIVGFFIPLILIQSKAEE